MIEDEELINLGDEIGHENETSTRAAWNELLRAYLVELLVELLVEFNRPGKRLQNAWSSVAWNEISQCFKLKFPSTIFSVKQLKEQERQLKRQYKAVKKLTEQSGFGWDPVRKMVTAPEEVWVPLLLKDKEAKRWYNKPFPYYDDLHNLYSGVIATGLHRSGTNHLASQENPMELNSPTPTITAPGGFNLEFDDDLLDTPEDDSLSTHVPPQNQTPVLTENNTSRPKNKSGRKRKAMSEFHEEYLAYKREETRAYCAQMEKNSKRGIEREEKFFIAAVMDAYQKLPEFDIVDFIYASEMFMGGPKICEAFLSCHEANCAVWIKQMIERYKEK